MQKLHGSRKATGRLTHSVCICDRLNCELHFHKGYEILYVIEGKMICNVNGKTKIVEEGSFVFCFPDEPHSIKSIGGAKVWIGIFSEDYIKEFSKLQKGKTGVDFCFRCSDEVFQYLSANLIREKIFDTFLTKSCLYALCSEYLRQISLEENSDKQIAIMRNTVEYVNKNFRRDISLADLAELLGYEYYYFSKTFNKLFAMSFNEYLNIHRFNEACRMLTQTDLSIASVAEKSGFQSTRSFNNIFKALAGVSPGEYRNQNGS